MKNMLNSVRRARFLKTTIACLVCITLIAGVVFATSSYTKTLNVQYTGIKLMVEGNVFVPKDVNGNIVEPFIYEGTTYLPVRAVASALGEKVTWDSSNNTVIIGGTDVTYLDTLGYLDHTSNGAKVSVTSASKDYPHGIEMYTAGKGEDGSAPTQELTYALDGKYTKFETTLVGVGYNGDGSVIKFYGDGHKLLYTSLTLDHDSQDIPVELDVTGQSRLYISATNPNFYEGKVVLNNARLIN